MSKAYRAVFILMTALTTLWQPLAAQTATLRLNLPDPAGYQGFRPENFPIERTAVVGFSGGLEAFTPLGDFLTRSGRDPKNMPDKLGIDGGHRPRTSTSLSAATDGRKLRLLVDCEEPSPEMMGHEIGEEYSADDRIEILLDLEHNHHDFFRIRIWPDGKNLAVCLEAHENHLAWDRRLSELEDRKLDYRVAVSRGGRGWTAKVDIAIQGVGEPVRPWRALGLNVIRQRGVEGDEVTMWCPDRMRVGAPLYFGDLYLGAPPLVVSAVKLGRVCWGDNRGELVCATAAKGLTVEAVTYNYKGVYDRGSFPLDQGRAAFTYRIDPHELMHSALEISIGGQRWGSYEFGWKRSILLTQRPTGRFEALRPLAGDPDYSWKYCRYILDRLPLFERTPDGLGLTAEGTLRTDLRERDALDRLAEIVMQRFSTDEDRLAAATLIFCQEGLMVSSGVGAGIAETGDGLEILRVGAAFCDSYGSLLRDLLHKVRDSRGMPFESCVVNFVPNAKNTFGWPHHWLAGVVYHGGIALLDSELGIIYVVPEEGRLATLKDLLARPGLADLSAYGLSDYYEGHKLEDFKVREVADFWNLR